MSKFKYSRINLLTFVIYFLSGQVSYAQQCSIHLNFGVIIDPNNIRIVEKSKTQLQINASKQLFIGGREIILSSEQTKLLGKFSYGIRQQIPEIVSIAIEGIDVSFKAVNQLVVGLTGENSEAQQKIRTKFDELKWRIRARFNQSTNNYFIAPQDLTDFDEILTGEFKQEIESMISGSIGTILETVGQSLLNDTNSNEYGSEVRINTLDPKITNISKGFSLTKSNKAKALDNRISLFCSKLKELNKIEDELQSSIPEISGFNIIEISAK
jgi:hypothetical protein